MQKSQKVQSIEVKRRRLLNPLESPHIGYSPQASPLLRPIVPSSMSLSRKTSLVELNHIPNDSVRLKENRKLKRPTKLISSNKILQIVKEAQMQLKLDKEPHNPLKLPKHHTLENQFEGMNFTFARNFTTNNKQILLKEFSAQSLRKKFYV